MVCWACSSCRSLCLCCVWCRVSWLTAALGMNSVENYCHYSSHNFMFDGLSELGELNKRRQIVAGDLMKKKKKTKKSICYSYSQLKLVYSQSSSRRHFAPLTYCGAARSQLMSCWLLITEHREFGVVKLSQIAMWNVTKSASWRGLRCAKKNAAKSTARKCYKLLSKKVNECDEPLKEMRFRADFMLQLSS